MDFEIEKKDTCTILQLKEKTLDATIAPGLKSEIRSLDHEGVHNLILDLAEVKYLNSSGLSVLIIANRLFSRKGKFILTNVNDHVMKLIRLSQLDSILTIKPSIEEAVSALN